MRRLSEEQKELLSFLPSDGTAIGGYTLFQSLQEYGWRSKKIEQVMDELRELDEIIVGRGGSGGSVRHVRNDRRALLDMIAELEAQELSCTRARLAKHLEWNPQYLERVLEYLVDRGRVEIGRGGVISLPEEQEPEPTDPDDADASASDPAADEQALLTLIPSSGAISNTRLRKTLADKNGWEEARYWETRKRLRERGLIEIGAGRGGSVRRVNAEMIVFGDDSSGEQEPTEPQGMQDERTILHQLPESGETKDLGTLQRLLNLPSERFFGALERLDAAGKIHWRQSKIKRLPFPPPPEPDPTPAPPPCAPSPAIDPNAALAALSKFILDRFDANSLERFIEIDLNAPLLSREISWNSIQGFADIAFRVSSLLKREGYLDAGFFETLSRRFPRLSADIDGLASHWTRG